MFFARAAVPVWVVVLGLAAVFAPAGIATTVLVVALCLVCIPALFTAGFMKRTLRAPGAEEMSLGHGERQPDAIEADFEVTDVTPVEGKRS